jgi:HEAT repeat protein
VAPLIVRFERGSPLARDTAARALAQIGDPRGIDVLLSALKSPDWGVRMHVASALRGVDEPRVVTALIDLLLHDPEGNVRSEAATALGESKDPRVVPALTQALEDESAQWSAEEALESLREQKPGHGLTPH